MDAAAAVGRLDRQRRRMRRTTLRRWSKMTRWRRDACTEWRNPAKGSSSEHGRGGPSSLNGGGGVSTSPLSSSQRRRQANEAGPCRFGVQGIDGGRRLPYDVSRHVFGVTEEPRTLSALPCAGLHYSETSRAPSQLPVPRSVSSQLRYGAARPGTVVPATAATARGSIRASRGMVRRSCRRLRRASTRTHTLM